MGLWGLTILMSLQSSPVCHVHPHRASSLLHLQTYVATFMKSSLAQLDVFVLFDLAGRDQGVRWLLATWAYGLAGSAPGPVQQQADWIVCMHPGQSLSGYTSCPATHPLLSGCVRIFTSTFSVDSVNQERERRLLVANMQLESLDCVH